jgi:hypothetical protein
MTVAGTLPAVAGAAVAVLYDTPLLLLLVLIAAACAAAAPVAAGRRRPGLGAPGALLGLVVLVVALALVANAGTGPAEALRELAGSTKHLLSFAPPVPTRLDTLAPPLVVVWVAAFSGAALAARGRRLLASAPAVGVLVAALLLVGRAAPVPGWVAPAVAAGVAILIFDGRRTARTGPERQTERMRQTEPAEWEVPLRSHTAGRVRRSSYALAAGAVVLLVASGLLAARTVPDDGRIDLRAQYQPPEQQPQPIDPLTRLAGWAKGDSQLLASVHFVGGGPVAGQATTWRWAILDRFDGARWTSSIRYRPAGHRMREPASGQPEPAGDDRPAGTVEARLEIDPTLAPWLPTPGPVRQLTGPSVAVNGEHDSVMATSGPTSYGLVADSATLDPTRPADQAIIATLTAGTPANVADAVAAPELPDSLHDIADRFAPSAGKSDGNRALELQELLRNGEFVTNAPPGHLYVRLAQFFDDHSPAYLKGTSEQFATAFAVLARTVGLPTRVVVGFGVPPGAPTQIDITGPGMRAWPEVYFTGRGWVRFEPTPTNSGTSAARTRPKLKDLLPAPPPPADAQPVPAGREGQHGHGPRHSGSGVSAVAIGLVVLGGLLAVAVLTLLVLAVLRWRLRSRRRRLPADAGRVIGAWREFEDAAELAGVGSRPAPATVVATHVAARINAPPAPLHELARIANAAAFGPDGMVGPHDAVRAWAITDRATAALRGAAPRRRRLSWWVRPGPLRSRR